MPQPDESLPQVFVRPGESILVSVPMVLRTLLGSCVGIALRIPRLGIGALCHPMLPICPAGQGASLSTAAGRRYVDFAIRDLARQFDALGAHRGEVKAKLFGGGDVLAIYGDESRPTVGRLNCQAALRVLAEEDIDVVASSLGGECGVNIHFNTGTGEVLLKRHR